MIGNEKQNFSAVAEMKEYIHTHLQEKITSIDIARAAGYSQYHAARLFKEETGVSPFEYIHRLRLVRSAHALRGGRPKVLDIALDFVFDSHEGFTRAFSNAFGITPKKYANYPKSEGWQIPYHYFDRHKSKPEVSNMDMKTSVIFTQIIDRPARKLILRRSKNANDYFEYCDEVGCGDSGNSEPWDILCNIKEALYEPVGLWLPKNMQPEGTGIYAHGVEVPADYSGPIPEGFEIINLEPCKLLVFQGEPYDDNNFEEAVGLCMERIKKFNPEIYGFVYAPELAPRMQLSPMGWRGYIEMAPIKNME